MNISKTQLNEIGCSQSQFRDLRISSSASMSLCDLLPVSISLLLQLIKVLFGSKFKNFVEWAIYVSISWFLAEISRQASAFIINRSISSMPLLKSSGLSYLSIYLSWRTTAQKIVLVCKPSCSPPSISHSTNIFRI